MEKTYLRIVTEFSSVFLLVFMFYVIFRFIYYFNGPIGNLEKQQKQLETQQNIIEQKKYDELYKMYNDISNIINYQIYKIQQNEFKLIKDQDSKILILQQQLQVISDVYQKGNSIVGPFSDFYTNKKSEMIPENRRFYNEYLRIYFEINNQISKVNKLEDSESIQLTLDNVNYFISINSQLQKIQYFNDIQQSSVDQFVQIKSSKFTLEVQQEMTTIIRGEILLNFNKIVDDFALVRNQIILVENQIQQQINDFNFQDQINNLNIEKNNKDLNEIQVIIKTIQEEANVVLQNIKKIFQIKAFDLFFSKQMSLLKNRISSNYFIYSNKETIQALIDKFTLLNTKLQNCLNIYYNSNLTDEHINLTFIFLTGLQSEFQELYEEFHTELQQNKAIITKRKIIIYKIINNIQQFFTKYKQFCDSQNKGFIIKTFYRDENKQKVSVEYNKFAAYWVFQQLFSDLISLLFSYIQNIYLHNEDDIQVQIDNILNFNSGNLEKAPYSYLDHYLNCVVYFV